MLVGGKGVFFLFFEILFQCHIFKVDLHSDSSQINIIQIILFIIFLFYPIIILLYYPNKPQTF